MGSPKGRLVVPGTRRSILEHLVEQARLASLESVLVGEASIYSDLLPRVLRLQDDPVGVGPLGGLRAALLHASAAGQTHLIAVACDMPYVESGLLLRLATHPSSRAIVAPRRTPDAPWEPMLARYRCNPVISVVDKVLRGGRRSLQSLFSECEVEPLTLNDTEVRSLEDWDTPDDVVR